MFRYIARTSLVSLLSAGCVLAIGCSSSSTPGGAASSISSVDPSSAVDALSASDGAKFCADFGDYFVRQLQDPTVQRNRGCAYNAITAGSDKATCRATYTACMADAGALVTANPPAEDNSKCPEFAASVAGCTLTVGQLEQCVTDFFAEAKSFTAESVCDELEDGGDTTPGAGEPASCALFVAEPACSALAIGSPLPSVTSESNITPSGNGS